MHVRIPKAACPFPWRLAPTNAFCNNAAILSRNLARAKRTFSGKSDANSAALDDEEDSESTHTLISSNGIAFRRFPAIVGLHNIVKRVAAAPIALDSNPIVYRGKVKLHGVNAAITWQRNGMAIQSRNTFLDRNEYHGRLVYNSRPVEKYFSSLFDNKAGYDALTLFGEYCGQGVQKRTPVSIAQVKEKQLAIFALQIDNRVIVEPSAITRFLSKNDSVQIPDRVHVLPWSTEPVSLQLTDKEQLQAPVEQLNQLVAAVDKEDPWVKAKFGISGAGEGLVFYPTSLADAKGEIDLTAFERYTFKAKGKSHEVVLQRKPVLVEAEKAESIEKFVQKFLTPGRLQQGVHEVKGLELKLTGNFVQWIRADVEQEGKDELEASNLPSHLVQQAVTRRAAVWYKAEVEKLKTASKIPDNSEAPRTAHSSTSAHATS